MHHFGCKRGRQRRSIIFLVTFMFWNIGEKHDFLLSQVDKKNQTCKVCTRLESLLFEKAEKVAPLDGKLMSRKSPLFSVLYRLSNIREKIFDKEFLIQFPIQPSNHKRLFNKNLLPKSKSFASEMSSNKSTLLKVPYLAVWRPAAVLAKLADIRGHWRLN